MKSNSPLILLPFSGLYTALTRVRLTAYRQGWMSVSQLAAPVISVGNLTTGGTGKTPLVDWVCRVVAKGDQERQKKVCVLTRGYRRRNPESQVVVSNGTDLLTGEPEAGDEAFLLAQNLIGVAAVIANPNRSAAGTWAMENLNAEVFVLDDGFQHLQLARDLDIVTIDATNPFGNGSLLPYGRLREPLSSLARAGCVVITRTEQVEDWVTIKRQVERVARRVPIFSSRMVTGSVRRLNEETINANELKNQPLGAFCGVGNPDSFFAHLRNEGYSIPSTRAFADHHDYNQGEVDRLVQAAKSLGCEAMITTEKDATKLHGFNFELPCYVLNIRIAIDDEEELVGLIRDACRHRE